MRRESRLGHLALALVAVAAPVRAHGPAPAVLEVLATDTGGPSWLRATVGLLRRNPDGTWAHVCPDHWDGNDRMRAAVAGDTALVISAEGFSSPTDRCEPWRPLGAVRFAASERSRLVWLEEGAEGHVLNDQSGALALVPDAIGTVQSLEVADGRALVGGREGLAFWDEGWTVVPLPSRLRYLRAARGRSVYAVGAVDGALVPERIDVGTGTATSGPPADQLLGPAFFGEEARVFADGEWLAERGGEWVSLGPDDRRWTYVEAVEGVTYAASLEGVFRLDASELPAAELVFRFTQIVQSPCAVCEPDWAHFGGESGWLDTRAATEPDGEREPIHGSCTAAGSPSAPSWLAVLLLATRRRPRSCAAR